MCCLDTHTENKREKGLNLLGSPRLQHYLNVALIVERDEEQAVVLDATHVFLMKVLVVVWV